jgi:putative transposase
MARLLIEVFYYYREKKNYLLHEFVVMPDHIHLLLSPITSLERSMQLIKGGFSYSARKELGFSAEIWEKSFYDQRARDVDQYFAFAEYIRQNPVKRGLVVRAEDYPYSSAHAGFVLDGLPERLKPSLKSVGLSQR